MGSNKNRGECIIKTENNMDVESKENPGKVLQDEALQKCMSSIKHKFLVISSQKGVGKTSVIMKTDCWLD